MKMSTFIQNQFALNFIERLEKNESEKTRTQSNLLTHKSWQTLNNPIDAISTPDILRNPIYLLEKNPLQQSTM